MNKKEFKAWMQQGLGRCALILQKSDDKEAYRSTVLWGCLHALSYDLQCEGTRAEYVYRLTAFFADRDYFLTPCIEAFSALPPRRDELLAHLTDLLCCFARDGSTRAKEAILQRYEALLAVLTAKRRGGSYDYERDALERLAVALLSLDGDALFLRVAADLGALFTENPRYGITDFDWLLSVMEEGGEGRLRARLGRAAKTSEAIAAFFRACTSTEEEETATASRPAAAPTVEDITREVAAEGKLSPATRVRFARRADAMQKRALAEAALKETDPERRAALLSPFAFRSGGFPLSHDPLISDARSAHEGLREVALHILEGCRSDTVMTFAEELLAEGEHRAHALCMLLTNYTPQKKQALLRELYATRVDYANSTGWHGMDTHILATEAAGVKLPREFFLYVYHTTLCSHCREAAVRLLAKHRWLTREVIEEGRYDSNADIARYIARYYPE